MRKFDSIHGIVSDIDGVWFQGNALQKGGHELMEALHRRSMKVAFASNGAASAKEVAKKFSGAGIDVDPASIITAGDATVQYLKEQQAKRGEDMRVLFLGPENLEEQCHEAGIANMMTQAEVWDGKEKKWIADRQHPSHVVTVRHAFTQDTIEAAAAGIRRQGEWIASGMDHAVTTETTDLRAGTGTMVAAVQRLLSTSDYLENAEPKVMGKPHPRIIRAALAQMGLHPKLTAMLGDSLETDMTVARRLAMTRWLVLSGVTSWMRATRNEKEYDHRFRDIGQLAEEMREEEERQS